MPVNLVTKYIRVYYIYWKISILLLAFYYCSYDEFRRHSILYWLNLNLWFCMLLLHKKWYLPFQYIYMKNTTSAYNEKLSMFFSKFAIISDDNNLLADTTLNLMQTLTSRPVKKVADFGSGSWIHTMKVLEQLWAERVIAVDNSKDQLKISIDNLSSPNTLQYVESVVSYANEIDATFSKHTFCCYDCSRASCGFNATVKCYDIWSCVDYLWN